MVFLAPVVTRELLELHIRLHRMPPVVAGTRREYYLPGRWVPHCTIAEGLEPDDIRTTVELAYGSGACREVSIQEVGTGPAWPVSCDYRATGRSRESRSTITQPKPVTAVVCRSGWFLVSNRRGIQHRSHSARASHRPQPAGGRRAILFTHLLTEPRAHRRYVPDVAPTVFSRIRKCIVSELVAIEPTRPVTDEAVQGREVCRTSLMPSGHGPPV